MIWMQKKTKKLVLAITIPAIAVAGVATFLIINTFNQDRTKLLRNYAYFKDGNLTNQNEYQSLNKDEIDELLNLGIPFIVYLTNDTCSHCQRFKPIMDEWVKNEAHFVVRLSGDDAENINFYYNGLFERENLNGDKNLSFPTVGIMKSKTEFDIINNQKYMQTKSAFMYYMNKTYETSNVYYTKNNVFNDEIKKEYTYISYMQDMSNISLYNDKLKNKIIASNNYIVISPYNADSLEIGKMKYNDQNKNYLEEITTINADTSLDSLNKYF